MNAFNLTVTQLSKRYGNRQILDNISLTLQAGECVLLTGKNGSGKTTLMRILAGLERPDHCMINDGSDQLYSWKRYRNTLQSRVMYLHQQPYLFSGSVRKNLAFALPRGLSIDEQHQRLQTIGQWAGLDDMLEASAKTLSGGECQRVAIARALLRSPSALLLDEPTASMDQEGRDTMLKLLQQLREEKVALLVASHDAERFQGVASGEVRLEGGHIAEQMQPPSPALSLPREGALPQSETNAAETALSPFLTLNRKKTR